jgi:hypothetical protein
MASIKSDGRIPEPSPRTVMWCLAFAAFIFVSIIAYDYAHGDPRLSWSKPPWFDQRSH